MSKNVFSTKTIAKIAIVAAIYVALTLAVAPLSYGDLQVRFSEALLLLCFFNPIYAIALILGCFLANLASPLGWYDLVFGTGQTVISVVLILFAKKAKLPLWVASLAAIVGTPLIGWELKLAFELPFVASTLWVALGEFIAVTVIGVPIFAGLRKAKWFQSIT